MASSHPPGDQWATRAFGINPKHALAAFTRQPIEYWPWPHPHPCCVCSDPFTFVALSPRGSASVSWYCVEHEPPLMQPDPAHIDF